MILTAEQKCLLWLSSAEITAGRVGEMIAYYGSAQAIWDAFGGANGPVFRGRAQEILAKLHSRAAIDDLIASLEKKSVRLLFSTDEAYPQQLRCIQDPPYLLYCAGRLSCPANAHDRAGWHQAGQPLWHGYGSHAVARPLRGWHMRCKRPGSRN